MADRKKIKDLSTNRGQLIQTLLDKLESKVQAAQRGLLKLVLEDFLDGMEKDEDGNIKNTLANKRRFSMFDTVFNRYIKDKGLEVVKTIAEGVGRVADFNQQYFSVLDRDAFLAPIHDNVRETLGSWLGLNTRGNVAPNGYLDTLLKDSSVKNTIKNIALKGVISQNGYNDLKKTLALHIEGNQEQTGALQRYYRNFAYDTYSITDRTAAKIYADKLKFNFAIYEGGLIETSREFCEEHNGKVYSREEIGKMQPTKAIPPGYDPFTDMGGYGCRHHWNWVPDAVAFSMRPELKNMQPGKEEPAPAPPVKQAPPIEPAPVVPEKTGSTFKPSLNVKEAEAYAKNTIGVKFADFKGLDIDVVNDINRTVQKIRELMPQIRTNGIGSAQKANKAMKDKILTAYKASDWYKNQIRDYGQKMADGLADSFVSRNVQKVGSNTIAWSTNREKVRIPGAADIDVSEFMGVFVNEKYGKSKKVVDQVVKDGAKDKWFTEGAEDFGYIMAHEIGHEIDKTINFKKTKDFTDIFDREHAKGIEHVINRLSKYGATAGGKASARMDEMIAEGWAEYVTSKNPRPLAKELGEAMLKVYYTDYIQGTGTTFNVWKSEIQKILYK
jgi:hypothetical protein